MENKLTTINYSIKEIEVMSSKVAQSNFLGTRNPNEVFTLLMLAQAEGKNPIQASMDYSIIQGRPALKSQATLVRFQKAGGKIEYLRRDDTECKIKFSHPQAGELTVSWTMQTAQQAGLNTSKDNWKKYPRQMLAARCIAEGVRALYPACLEGLYLVEEVQDFDNLNKNNVIDTESSSIDNSVYDIDTNTYSVVEESTEIDYTIIPKGPNKGQKWNVLSLNTIKKTIEYYLGKSNSDSQKYIDAIIQDCFEPINNNACAGDLIYCYDTKQICYIQEDIYEKESEYIVHYFQINNEKCLAKSYYYSECFVFKREDRESDLRKKYTKRKEAEGFLGVDKEKQDFPNITATEDEDPFSFANDKDWDKDWNDISKELDSTKSTLEDLVDDDTSLFNNGEK